MNPKIFGDVDDVDFSSTSTFENTNQGAAFEVVDPFSETKIVDYSETTPKIMSSIDDYSYDYLDYQESELMKLWHNTLDSIWGNSESSESADYDRFL
jgi:hypothetical protein